MRKLLVYISVLLFFCYHETVAQTAKTIAGVITDASSRKPVSYASITLLAFSDSSNVKMAVADSTGRYELKDLKAGRYYLYTKCMGYKDRWDTINALQESDRAIIRDIVLASSENQVKEVVVAGKIPPVQVKADRVIVNVAGSVNATGSSVYELLLKSPGVRQGNDDAITINGRTGLQVYQDGRQLTLSGKELTDLLKSMQSADIGTIEIITNPSARYEAAGNAGIINIKTRKGQALGFNSNVTLTAGFGSYNPKYDAGINLNYRIKKFNFFGNYNYFTGNSLWTIDFFRIQNNSKNEPVHFDQRYRNVIHSSIHTFKAGADYFISPRSRLSVIVDANIPATKSSANSITPIYKIPGKIDSTLLAGNEERKSSHLYNYSVNYRYADKDGRELVADGSYIRYNMDANSFQPNYYMNNGGNGTSAVLFHNFNAAKIDIYAGKLDYQQPLFGGTLNAGVKVSGTRTDNSVHYFKVDKNNLPETDTARTNQFVYDEKIYAAYVNYNLAVGKWTFVAGLRGEQTNVDGRLRTLSGKGEQALDSQYINLFPNVAVTYDINEDHTLELSYNKRIDRPVYQDLNPFEFVLDELSYMKGNPFLKPQFSSTVKLSHAFRKFLTTSVSYTDVRDFMVRYRDTISAGRTFQTNINVAHQYTYNLSTTVQLAPLKWWNFYYTLGLFHQKVSGVMGGGKVPISTSDNFWSITGSNTFSIGKGWSAELSGFYNSDFPDVPATIYAQWQLDAGIQKKILKDAGVLRLSVSDMFNSFDYTLKRDFGGLYYTGRNKRETQQVKISFTYRFGNNQVKGSSAEGNGLKDEKNRIK
ncbi:outer membrane beta-barrel family protein [Chitinophaga nivalis]|uniref:TonB-dependent receptor n=1 Tax=Chitinophaga nivalis TaxID=2991709 RepID=A0ABT3IK87_9BACT|nr:outer membrane beta-barrel family protein [Chitinophaga nivalis]MCW3465929.1 TonB-dependent receptor [Chitinophaga nivalis]MCW3484380.1 TonB-dependent receptor [Chitinophaga nivalis]